MLRVRRVMVRVRTRVRVRVRRVRVSPNLRWLGLALTSGG